MAGWLIILVTSLALLVHSSILGSSDGRSMYEVTRSLVEDGDVAITQGVVWKGKDGRNYSPYGLGLSLIAVVPYLVARPISNLSGDPEAIRQAGVAALMPLLVGLLAAALYALSRRLGGGPRASLVVALGAVGGTFLLVYTKDFFSEPLAALCLTLSIERAVARKPGWSGVAAAAAALTRPQCFAFSPLLFWRLRTDEGWPAVGRAALPIAAALALSLGYNVVRFGDMTNFGYSNSAFPQTFTTPFLSGAAGLLFHPHKSLLLFAPVTMLLPAALAHLWNRHRTAFWLLSGNLVITFVISATWWAWGGGWVWGPRLLIPGVIPALAALGAWATHARPSMRRLAGALLVLGFLVNAPAVLVGVGEQLGQDAIPRFGPSTVRQARLVPGAVSYSLHHATDQPPTAPSVATWQFRMIRHMGRRGIAVAVLGSSLLVLAASFAALRLRRALQLTDAPHSASGIT